MNNNHEDGDYTVDYTVTHTLWLMSAVDDRRIIKDIDHDNIEDSCNTRTMANNMPNENLRHTLLIKAISGF